MGHYIEYKVNVLLIQDFIEGRENVVECECEYACVCISFWLEC